MPIHYSLTESLELLATRLDEDQRQRDYEEKPCIPIISKSLRIEHNELYFRRTGFSESPFSWFYDEKSGTLKIAYDMASSSHFGSGVYEERIPLPELTQQLEFGIKGGDVVDSRTGKALRDLTEEEYRLHAFPNMR